MTDIQINLHEAKARLAHYARLVKAGETIVLCDRNKPFAEIRPLGGVAPARPKRQLGQLAGLCQIGPEFLEPDAELAADFESGPAVPPMTSRLP